MNDRTLATEKHTPGPWELYDELHRDEQYVIGIRGTSIGTYVIASVDYGYSEPFESQQQANARLIAAAPDLLAALKELGDWVAAGLQASDKAWPDARCLQHTEEIAARARAAVDKAEGRS